MTLFDMSGKVAVITGSTRGIGRAIAERMAEHGAKVVVSSRKQDVCDQVSKEINDRFGKGAAVAIAANISSKENLQNLVTESDRAVAAAAQRHARRHRGRGGVSGLGGREVHDRAEHRHRRRRDDKLRSSPSSSSRYQLRHHPRATAAPLSREVLALLQGEPRR